MMFEEVARLAREATDAPTRTLRLDACRTLGDLAGRARGADWDVAERAAFALLEAARVADAWTDRRDVVAAMGRGFRNLWLLPFVHRRMSDADPRIAAAAIGAAGGLGFPALEHSVAAYVDDELRPRTEDRGPKTEVRRAAIAALGRMGAMSAVDALGVIVEGADADDAAAALTALAEIRSPAGCTAAVAIADRLGERDLQIAAVRYLCELGDARVLTALRRMARASDPELRLTAMLGSRALADESKRDPEGRFLVALGETDRAVRARLARRLRTLPVSDVIAQAEILLDADAGGVVEIVGELRGADATKWLLALAGRSDLSALVRARAIGAVEAAEPWEREALATLAHRSELDAEVRGAAIQAMGAFASSRELLERLGDLATSDLRGAVLWAIQLASRTDGDAPALAAIVEPLLDDTDERVRRRAAYVAGNLGLASLAPALARRVAPSEPADLRVAAYVALGELGMPGVAANVAAQLAGEHDPRVCGAASNAFVAAAKLDPAAKNLIAARVPALIAGDDARLREAGAELAGVVGEALTSLVPLVSDPSPRVRAAAVWALGRLGDARAEAALLGADRDDDPAVRERAAFALLRIGTPEALARAIAFVASDGDDAARAEIAGAIVATPELAPAVETALARISPDDDAYEPLLRLRVTNTAAAVDVDAELSDVFPAFAQLAKLAGFDPLVRSVRTAESLFHSGGGDDLSAPITLWMKALENYVHAWLAPRMQTLQREPAALFEYVDRVVATSWPTYARWVEPRWRDPQDVGGAVVDLPLRQVPNAVRELQEHRRKRLDSPLSVTEWARMLVLFGVDHPASGFKNLFALRAGDRAVTLAHRLHTLAAVRNLVTHRANAGASTLNAFRRTYYATFEDLVGLV